jgi:hypothetical protein
VQRTISCHWFSDGQKFQFLSNPLAPNLSSPINSLKSNTVQLNLSSPNLSCSNAYFIAAQTHRICSNYIVSMLSTIMTKMLCISIGKFTASIWATTSRFMISLQLQLSLHQLHLTTISAISRIATQECDLKPWF